MLTRRGSTLVELVIALVLAAIVLGAATASVLRQQRTATRIGAMARAESQLHLAVAALPAELSALAPSVGDLVAGEARDTSVQLRAPVATGFACEQSVGQVVLGVSANDSLGGGVALSPRTGDSLWWYRSVDSAWRGGPISAVSASASPCAATGGGGGTSIRLMLAGADTIAAESPVRITRQLRYVVYRSGDGSWQLGLREWSDATQRMAAPQPLAGPFVRRIASGEQTGFRYFDAGGAELLPQVGGVDVSRVARIRITMLATEGPPSSDPGTVRRDSLDVALQRVAAP